MSGFRKSLHTALKISIFCHRFQEGKNSGHKNNPKRLKIPQRAKEYFGGEFNSVTLLSYYLNFALLSVRNLRYFFPIQSLTIKFLKRPPCNPILFSLKGHVPSHTPLIINPLLTGDVSLGCLCSYPLSEAWNRLVVRPHGRINCAGYETLCGKFFNP